jgi:rRNA-processing protein FCF1
MPGENKRARKLLTYYRAVHHFRPPYEVILDGTAIMASLHHGVALDDLCGKVLQNERFRLLVPRSVVAELHALGRPAAAAAKLARRLKVIDAPESAGPKAAAAEELVALVAGGNPAHRFVLTEDPALRERLAQYEAVPLLRFNREGRLLLEAPGRGYGHGWHPDGKDGTPARESVARMGQAAGRVAVKAATLAASSAVTTSNAALLQEDAAKAPAPSRKRKMNEPNPLSVKKKKKSSPPRIVGGHTQPSIDSGSSKPKRRRRRGST